MIIDSTPKKHASRASARLLVDSDLSYQLRPLDPPIGPALRGPLPDPRPYHPIIRQEFDINPACVKPFLGGSVLL